MIENTIKNFRFMRSQGRRGAALVAEGEQRRGLAQRQIAQGSQRALRAGEETREMLTPVYNPGEKIEGWANELDSMREQRRLNSEQSTTGALSVVPEGTPSDNPLARPRPQAFSDTVGGETGSQLVSDLMEELDISREQAAGIVGNLHVETGGFKFMQEIEPLVPGSRGGLGFAQWTGPRRVNFENWAKENNLDTRSYEANKGFLLYEILNTNEGRFMDDLRNATTPEAAAMIVSEQYLRPGIPHNERRVALAQQYTR